MLTRVWSLDNDYAGGGNLHGGEWNAILLQLICGLGTVVVGHLPDHIVDFDLYHEVRAALQIKTEADVLSEVLFELRSLEEIARSAAVPFGLVPGPEHYDQAQRGDHRDNDTAYTKIF